VKVPESAVIGRVKRGILADAPSWPVEDPLFVAPPVSALDFGRESGDAATGCSSFGKVFSRHENKTINQPETLNRGFRTNERKKSVIKTRILPIAAALLAFAFVVTTAPAQTTATAQAPDTSSAGQAAVKPSTFDAYIQQIKNPVDWLSWGGDLRVRNEYFNNALSLSSDPKLSAGGAPGVPTTFGDLHSQDYFRYRGRLWTSITPADGLTLNVRLAAEPREFMENSTFDTYYDKSGMQWRYGIIDNLNVQWKKPLDLPVTLTVGRQDIFLGDGFLVGDGTPEDGSFTSFLDSARLTWNLEKQHTTIDFIGIVQYARPDA
jgi:hypothetical protein